MMNDSGSTHRPRAVDPAKFRAMATGIGQSQSGSLATGGARAQRSVDMAPPGCVATAPAAEGFPTPSGMSARYPARANP